ncbi:hypothetical protein [Nocardia sp. MH4]|uniref:hypothetical protein n=1 Tax=Nocardia sp. MH4 TaxID=1768677 RepID=UPI001C4F8EB8|nr:hypothetical protein [Nocardia sp. MH4]
MDDGARMAVRAAGSPACRFVDFVDVSDSTTGSAAHTADNRAMVAFLAFLPFTMTVWSSCAPVYRSESTSSTRRERSRGQRRREIDRARFGPDDQFVWFADRPDKAG